MRILIHDYPGHPGQVYLSRELARRGYQILHLYAGYNQTPRGALQKNKNDPNTFNIEPLFLRRPLQKYSFIKRFFQEVEYGRLLAERTLEFQPDVIISGNTPLDAQANIYRISKKLSSKFIFWVQDVIGIATYQLLRRKIPILGSIIGKYYIGMESRLLRNSDEIVLISEDFMPLMDKWKISLEKLHIIPNWGPIDEIPVCSKNNEWSIAQGINEKFCFLYAGTLGMKHNPELIFKLASHFQDNKDVVVMVVSSGPGADWLKDKKQEHGLNNLQILDFQPYDMLPNLLASGDVLLANLEYTAGSFSVPGKVLSNLCAQRPQLIAIPEDNLAAKIVSTNKAGIVVPPDKEEEFLASAVELYNNPSLRNQLSSNARKYAEKTFDIASIGDKFESIILGKPR